MAQTTSWDNVLSVSACVHSLSGRELRAYEREGYTQVMRVQVDAGMRRVNGKDVVSDWLLDPTLEQYRIWYRGRTLNAVGIVRPTEGVHDTMAGVMFIDCIETPIPVGNLDA